MPTLTPVTLTLASATNRKNYEISSPNRTKPSTAIRAGERFGKNQKQNARNNLKKRFKTMKKERKKQEDRLLKQLSLRDRQRQLRLRQQIMEEALFLVI